MELKLWFIGVETIIFILLGFYSFELFTYIIYIMNLITIIIFLFENFNSLIDKNSFKLLLLMGLFGFIALPYFIFDKIYGDNKGDNENEL